jgi:hypothetical protein
MWGPSRNKATSSPWLRRGKFFLLTKWADGSSYDDDLARMARIGRLSLRDQKRGQALMHYLVSIHGTKRRQPDLYRRRVRELIGHGECIMGLTDSYPVPFGFITKDLLRSIEEACNRWRWRLRMRTSRLSQVPWGLSSLERPLPSQH